MMHTLRMGKSLAWGRKIEKKKVIFFSRILPLNAASDSARGPGASAVWSHSEHEALMPFTKLQGWGLHRRHTQREITAGNKTSLGLCSVPQDSGNTQGWYWCSHRAGRAPALGRMLRNN